MISDKSNQRTLHIGSNPPQLESSVITSGRDLPLIGKPIRYNQSEQKLGAIASALHAKLPLGSPLQSSRVNSAFGARLHPVSGKYRRHNGVDLAAATGTPVFATSSGSIRVAGWNGGYGLLITVDHGNGIETRYAHLSRLIVTRGQRVRTGEIIGFVGSTGNSTGPHLHYEIRQEGRPLDPAPMLQ